MSGRNSWSPHFAWINIPRLTNVLIILLNPHEQCLSGVVLILLLLSVLNHSCPSVFRNWQHCARGLGQKVFDIGTPHSRLDIILALNTLGPEHYGRSEHMSIRKRKWRHIDEISSLLALEVVILTTSSSWANDVNFIKMTTFPFLWILHKAFSSTCTLSVGFPGATLWVKRWLSETRWYLQCVSNGNTTVFHEAIKVAQKCISVDIKFAIFNECLECQTIDRAYDDKDQWYVFAPQKKNNLPALWTLYRIAQKSICFIYYCTHDTDKTGPISTFLYVINSF